MIIMLYDYLITLIPFEQVTLQSDIKNRPWILCPGIFKNQRELHKACEMQSGTTWLPQIIDSSVDNLYPSSLIRMHYAGVRRCYSVITHAWESATMTITPPFDYV